MSRTEVTILMPAYNVAAYIGEAIASVLEQDFPHFELLIVDDGSTDDTVRVIRTLDDPRIRLICQAHCGVAAALNHGLSEARGTYIARFDADDICLPGRISMQYHFLETHPAYVLCGGNAEYISAGGEHLFHFRCRSFDHEEIMRQMQRSCPFIHSAVMYRKDAVLECGGYAEAAHNFEDYLLWVRLSKYGKYANLREELIRVRFNPGSVTIDEKWRGRRFRHLKASIIRKGAITTAEGRELAEIIRNQELRRIKEGAYFALCGKKFLVDNHQPRKARLHLSRAIRIHPLRLDNYALYLLSFLPYAFIGWLHRRQTPKISEP